MPEVEEQEIGTDLVEAEEGVTTVVVPGTGELVDLTDMGACARALAAARVFEGQLAQVKRYLTEAIVADSEITGTKTLYAEGVKIEVKGGMARSYDAEEIEAELREAGMPEERIREIVVETTTYSVKAGEAKKAAAANAKYRKIIEDHTNEYEKTKYVSVSER